MGEHAAEIIEEQQKKERFADVSNDAYKRQWKRDQENEYTRISKYKEGLCYGCFKKASYAIATIINVCFDCASKKGEEAVLANVAPIYHNLCYVCGQYKFHILQKNVRLCFSCNKKVARITREYTKKGGHFETNPMYKKFRKKFGKDWKLLFQQPERVRI